VGSLVDYAAALAAAGRLTEADAVLARAARATPDVSPLPVAWIAFYRGTLAAEQGGDVQAAEGHYREALRLVPGFVRASVHLAELEAARGDEEAARARLRGVLGSEDPEPASRLAELSTGATRARLVRQARAGYEGLLGRHRAAYLDHALEFALAHEPRAPATHALAGELLSARPNTRSYQLALRDAAAQGDPAATCALAARARPLAATHPVLATDLASLGCP
jgi:tetratricopeptide (TPR) repeat protein